MNEKYFSGSNLKIIPILCLVGILGRLIPHIPNITPLNGICLFACSKMRTIYALAVTLIILLISDIALAIMYHHQVLSWWTLFTYTGFIGIVFLGSYLQKGTKLGLFALLAYVVSSSIFFWLWTNFGVWLTSSMYANNLSGLIQCYVMALPFLRNALLGDVCWGMAIFYGCNWIVHKQQLSLSSTT